MNKPGLTFYALLPFLLDSARWWNHCLHRLHLKPSATITTKQRQTFPGVHWQGLVRACLGTTLLHYVGVGESPSRSTTPHSLFCIAHRFRSSSECIHYVRTDGADMDICTTLCTEMSHLLFWPTITYFYPVGNTSAVCLTENLPPESKADLLLLACGDPRHILYTIYTNETNPLTCMYHFTR